MKLTKNTILLLVLAVFIRLFIMGSTFHADIIGQSLSSYFFAFKNVTNIYDHLASLPSTHPLVQHFNVKDIFIYPPLTYFTLGTFLKGASAIVPEKFFLDIMNGGSVYQPNLSLYLLIIKMPYLFIDIALAFALASLFNDQKQKRQAFLLWLFNPVTLYATFAMGVFDIIPTLFTVLALVFAKKNKLILSAIMIGIGIAYKQYPIFLLPFIVFSAKGFWCRVKVALAGIVPYLFTIAPFFTSSAFRYMVFSQQSRKMFYLQWMVSGAEGLYPYIIGFVLLIWAAFRYHQLSKHLWKFFLGYFLLLYSVTHFHPQWFLWVTPFVVIDLVVNKYKNILPILTIITCYIAIILTFDNSLSIGLFAVLNQNLNQFPGVDKLLAAKTDIFMLKSVIRSILAASSLFLILDLLKSKKGQISNEIS